MANIHLFEASPLTFLLLQKNTKDLTNITLVNKGLFNIVGYLDFNQSDNDALSSIVTKSSENNKIIKVEVTTIDDYMDDCGLKEIDFLKIDTEGSDFSILPGAQKALSERRIKVIQFEYGFVSVTTGNLLKNYYELLEKYGYTIGKIYPSSVEFSSYEVTMENFIGPNFLAVRSDLKELVDSLK